MKIYRYLFEHYLKGSLTILGYAVIMAIGTVLILDTIHEILVRLLAEQTVTDLLIKGIVGVALIYFSHPKLIKVFTDLLAEMTSDLKIRIVSKLSSLSLLSLEKLGTSQLFTVLDQNFKNFSLSSNPLLELMRSFTQMSVILIYALLVLSPWITLVIISLLIMMRLVSMFVINRNNKYEKIIQKESVIYRQYINDLVLGFKELKINPAKQEEFFGHQAANLQALHKASVINYRSHDTHLYNVKLFYYALIGIFFVVLPSQNVSNEFMIKAITLFMFMYLPMMRIVMLLKYADNLDKILVAALALEKTVDRELDERIPTKTKIHDTLQFEKELIFQDISFTYPTSSYTLGPLNLTLTKGEVLFIIGGNGSGKTTMLKTLTGLYKRTQGAIILDGQKVTEDQLIAFQNLFAAIFTDFHLPNKILGVQQFNRKKAKQLIKLLGLKGKTNLQGNTFTNIGLSTGQRKRLAMIIAFLEKKEIYIFDEVAADQDPDHRQFFYDFILPDIKAAKKTCIVVSHDEHYFHKADRILEMKEGQLHAYTIT